MQCIFYSQTILVSVSFAKSTALTVSCYLIDEKQFFDSIIGNNVKLKGSYVWNDVNVGDNASIVQTVVCSGAKLKK